MLSLWLALFIYLFLNIIFCFVLFFNFFFWLCWVFVAVHRLSLVVASGGYSLLHCMGFSLRWLVLLQSIGSRCAGFSSCGMQAQLWLLWPSGLVAPQHVGSSRTRGQTRVPCIGRWILNHYATREVPLFYFYLFVLAVPCLSCGTRHLHCSMRTSFCGM